MDGHSWGPCGEGRLLHQAFLERRRQCFGPINFTMKSMAGRTLRRYFIARPTSQSSTHAHAQSLSPYYFFITIENPFKLRHATIINQRAEIEMLRSIMYFCHVQYSVPNWWMPWLWSITLEMVLVMPMRTVTAMSVHGFFGQKCCGRRVRFAFRYATRT